jgi:hypothetical protein
MGINIASSRATVGTDGKTLREQLKENGSQLVDEMCRRARIDHPAMSLIVSMSDGRYYIQLCAGPFKTEEEAVGLFRDLAERQDDIVRESKAIQKRKEEIDAEPGVEH